MMTDKDLKTYEMLPQHLQSEEGKKLLLDPDRIVIWLSAKNRTTKGLEPSNNFYTYSSVDFSPLMQRLNEISRREEMLKAKGYKLDGIKSYNRNAWLDMSRQSNLIEGIIDDFPVDLRDFRAKLRGEFAIDPKLTNGVFDPHEYYVQLFNKVKEIESANDSVIISGDKSKHEIGIDTVKHFMAFKYIYKCAKSKRFYSQTEDELFEVLLNSASILSGADIVPFRNRIVGINRSEYIGQSNWTPESPDRISEGMSTLFSFLADDSRGGALPTIVAAALCHAEYIRIHPFLDGNGRTGRLLANYILIKDEMPTISFSYNDRNKYFAALNIAIDDHNLDALIDFIYKAMLNSIENIEKCLDNIELKQSMSSTV